MRFDVCIFTIIDRDRDDDRVSVVLVCFFVGWITQVLYDSGRYVISMRIYQGISKKEFLDEMVLNL